MYNFDEFYILSHAPRDPENTYQPRHSKRVRIKQCTRRRLKNNCCLDNGHPKISTSNLATTKTTHKTSEANTCDERVQLIPPPHGQCTTCLRRLAETFPRLRRRARED